MDEIRYPYRAMMRMWNGTVLGDPVPVRWVPAQPGAKVLEGPTPYRSLMSEDDIYGRPLGEQWTEDPEGCIKPFPKIHTNPKARCKGLEPFGPADAWLNGGTPGVTPEIHTDANGRSDCCPVVPNNLTIDAVLALGLRFRGYVGTAVSLDESPRLGLGFASEITTADVVAGSLPVGQTFDSTTTGTDIYDTTAGFGLTFVATVSGPPAVSASLPVGLHVSGTVGADAPHSVLLPVGMAFTSSLTDTASVAAAVPLGLSLAGSLTTDVPLSGAVPVGLRMAGTVTTDVPLSGLVPLGLGFTSSLTDTASVAAAVPLGLSLAGSLTTDVPLSGSLPVGLTFGSTVGQGIGLSSAVPLGLTFAGAVTTDVPTAGTLPIGLRVSATVGSGDVLSGTLPLGMYLAGVVDLAGAGITSTLPIGLKLAATVSTTDAGGGAAAFRSSSSTHNAIGTVTLNKPTGTASGDVLVAFITAATSSGTFTPPSGWTQLATGTWNGGTGGYWYGYKVAGGSEASSYSFSLPSGFASGNGAMACVSGGAAPDHHSEATGNDSAPTATGVTATAGSEGLVYYAYTAGFPPTITHPSGWTKREDPISNSVSYEMESKDSLSGATGSVAASLSGSAQWVALFATVPP